MKSDTDTSRRRLLQAAGVGLTAALAGCSSLNPLSNGEDVDQGSASIDPEDGVVTQVGPSQTETQQIQQDVLAEAESNSWNDSRTRQELNDRFRERVNEEIQSFRDWASSTDGVTVAGTVPEVGVILLDGDDSVLMDALRDGKLGRLMPGEEFERAQNAAESAGGGGNTGSDGEQSPGTDPGGNTTTGGNETSDGTQDPSTGNETSDS